MSLPPANLRYTIKVYIGIPVTDAAANTTFPIVAKQIAEALTPSCGGLTWQMVNGTWMTSATALDSIGPYSGEIEHDTVAAYYIVYSPPMESNVMTAINTLIPELLLANNINATNIHVEKSEAVGLHFQVKRP